MSPANCARCAETTSRHNRRPSPVCSTISHTRAPAVRPLRTRCRSAVAELAVAAAAPAPVPATDYNQGDFHGHIADTLLALPPSPTSRAAVAACLPSINPSQRAFKAKAVLPDLFPSPLPDPRPPYASLPRPQQQLLHAFADLSEGWWNTAGDIGENLTTYGLPDTQAALRAYIGLPLGSPPVPAREWHEFRAGDPLDVSYGRAGH
ncbi:hypothetical protein OIE61_04925 [Streptomyces sp. NBC_01762]|uniref:hypothetical protein n=1 Tax=unclassified Streptomyces TaxID=2593676 RepID=UPI002DDAFDA3|nr:MULTISPECIES: hypothetical protein [unclassified Streptomyces]WSC43352.1 hypothetical protein OIE61_04925 [Streptomyces sp. NBC_01762]WSD22889.1 hypothetical protein OHA26_04980 [Streptomyces sp. NBC_01751]